MEKKDTYKIMKRSYSHPCTAEFCKEGQYMVEYVDSSLAIKWKYSFSKYACLQASVGLKREDASSKALRAC